VPVVAAGEMTGRIHPLLNNRPFAGCADDEGMQIELKSVADSVVINAGGKAAGTGKDIAVQPGMAGIGT
jgi:hypothetical protein